MACLSPSKRVPRAQLGGRLSPCLPPPALPLREAVRGESGLLLLLRRSACVSEEEDRRNSVCNELVDSERRPAGAQMSRMGAASGPGSGADLAEAGRERAEEGGRRGRVGSGWAGTGWAPVR
jgi:hypothetical protein